MSFHHVVRAAAAMLFLAGTAVAGLGQDAGETHEIALYDAGMPSPKTAAAQVAKLRSAGQPPMLKAQVRFQTQPQGLVLHAQGLLAEDVKPSPPWIRADSLYVFDPLSAGKREPLILPMRLSADADPGMLQDIEEFWFDYAPVPGVATCEPQFRITAAASDGVAAEGGTHLIIGDTNSEGGVLTTLSTLDAGAATWREKGAAYLAARWLGTHPDDDWRYAASGPNTVLQRRMHARLDGVDVLEMTVTPGSVVPQVNLLISAKDENNAGNLLEFPAPTPMVLDDGRTVVRVDLRRALQKRFPRESAAGRAGQRAASFFLQEVLVFIAGTPASVTHAKALRSLSFLGSAESRQIPRVEFIDLPSKFSDYTGTRRRMVVDLRELRYRPVTLRHAQLTLREPPRDSACAIRLVAANLVALDTRQAPVFARALRDMDERWGGPFLQTLPRLGSFESPAVVRFLPLAALSAADGRSTAASERSSDLDAENQRTAPAGARVTALPGYRILQANGTPVVPDAAQLIGSGGAVLRSEGAMPITSADGDVLTLEGRSRRLQVRWPTRFRLDPDSWFYFGVADGMGDIGAVSLKLDLADRSVTRVVRPNQPLSLRGLAGDVRSVTLTIEPATLPFRLKLREMVILRPMLVDYATALGMTRPIGYSATPKPRSQQSATPIVEERDGHLAGILVGNGDGARFSTSFDPPLEWVRQVRIDYALPAVAAGEGSCRLRLRFNWAGGAIERQFCPLAAHAFIAIPISSFIGDMNEPHDLGPLTSIDWRVTESPDEFADAPQSFHVSFAVDGWTAMAATDELRLTPLLLANGRGIHPDATAVQELLRRPYKPDAWLALDNESIDVIAASNAAFQPSPNWLFTVDRLAAFSPSAIAPEPTSSAATFTPASPSPWPARMLWAGLGLLGWLAWRQMHVARGSIATALSRAVDAARATLRARLPPFGASPTIRAHAHVALAAAVFGSAFWLAGARSDGGLTVALALMALAVASGARRHWLRESGRELETLSRLDATVPMLALAYAFWTLGRYGLGARATVGLMPLAGLAYAHYPAIFEGARRMLHACPRCFVAAAWVAIAAALEAAGALSKSGGGENYWHTWGALAWAFAVRGLIVAVEMPVRSTLPRAASHVYGRRDAPYFAAAIVLVVMVGIALALHKSAFAEGIATVMYFCLGLGLAHMVWQLHARDREQAGWPWS